MHELLKILGIVLVIIGVGFELSYWYDAARSSGESGETNSGLSRKHIYGLFFVCIAIAVLVLAVVTRER